jgi:putative endopeptidase
MNKLFLIPLISISMLLYSCSQKHKITMPGIDLSNLDTTINPASNFYLYANGGWLKKHPMPSDYSRYGAFDKLQEDNDKLVHALVESITETKNQEGSVAQKVGDFFLSGMDTVEIEKEGISPLKPEFARIMKAVNIEDIQYLIGYYHSMDITPLFDFSGEPDSKNSEMMISHLYQGGLGLGDRDYYVNTNAHSKEIRSEYLKHIKKMLSLAGFDKESEVWPNIIMNIETRLAIASKTRLELRDPESNYNKIKLSDVQELTPNFHWSGYFKTIGLSNPGDINVGQPQFFKEVNKMLKDVSVEDWKAYLTWSLIDETAPYLSSAFVNQNFNFYDKFMTGRKTIRPRWRRVLVSTNHTMGEALGQLFVEKYFPPAAKQRMLKLVENLRLALADRIKKLTWMGDSTKEKALEKLKTISVKIGYPDKWREYSSLQINRNSYLTNVLNGRRFNVAWELNQINKPVDHSRWEMTPQTVNAYYNPSNNEICFPAGILQPPFFFADGDDAVNYGAIGVVIGHEITHGFDDQGRKYDKKGNLNEWWTKEDEKRFTEHADKLVKQFNSFVVDSDLHADGSLTLGENIADFGGLNISYTALQNALKENPAPGKIDGFTAEQRFYLAYAHVWGQHITDKEKIRLTKEDVHSLGEYRVLGPLENIPEFYKAFGVKPGDAMYLSEDKRAVIW